MGDYKYDEKSLIQLDMRAINQSFLEKNLYRIRNITDRLKEHNDVFLGVRNKRLTLYKYGREILTIRFDTDKDDSEKFKEVVIETRSQFSNSDLNNELEKIISNIPKIKQHGKKFGSLDIYDSLKNKKYSFKMDDLKSFSIKDATFYLIDNLKELMKKRYPKGATSEVPIEGLYMTKYNYRRKKYQWFYLIDMEFVLSKKAKEDIGNQEIHGRYDMLGIYRANESEKYKLVFIELKSKKNAMKDKESYSRTCGINSHIKDMDKFLMEYNKPDSRLKDIMYKNIKAIIDIKTDLDLINGLSIDDIIFENPEFWILFDMADGTKINSINDIKLIIGDIEKMKCKTKLRFWKGNLHDNENGKPKIDKCDEIVELF